jgi:hypothetical protein
MFTKQDGREGEKPTTGIHSSTRICSIFIYTHKPEECWWAAAIRVEPGPVGDEEKRETEQTLFFFFLISISRSPLNTHENNRVNRRLSFWCFFGGVCLFSSLSTDHYLKSHLFFLFFVSFVSYFNFDERVFSRFYFFFSFTSSSNSCSYLFSRLSTLFGYRSSCCCWCCVRIVLYEVCWIAPPPTRHRVDADKEMGRARSCGGKFDRREERQSISTFSRQCPSSSDSSQAKKSVKKRKDENINKHLRAATHTQLLSLFLLCTFPHP